MQSSLILEGYGFLGAFPMRTERGPSVLIEVGDDAAGDVDRAATGGAAVRHWVISSCTSARIVSMSTLSTRPVGLPSPARQRDASIRPDKEFCSYASTDSVNTNASLQQQSM